MIIQEKKHLIEQLHLRMFAEVQDYAIILLDVNGTILSWNVGARQITGYSENEILGQNSRKFYVPLDRQANLPEKLTALAMKEGRASHIGRRLRKDGSVFWGSINITALHDGEGKVIGFTKITRELRDHETS